MIQSLIIPAAHVQISDTIVGIVTDAETMQFQRGFSSQEVKSIDFDPRGCNGKLHVNGSSCYDGISTVKVQRKV